MTGHIQPRMRTPIVRGLVGGTLVHTSEGLIPIANIRVGDLVLSRQQHSFQAGVNDYKRVTKTFFYESQQVVNFCWHRHLGNGHGEFDHLFGTPNISTWNQPDGWMHIIHITGTTFGPDEWLGKNLVLADRSDSEMYEFERLYRTDKEHIAFMQEDAYGYGTLVDLSLSPHKFLDEQIYDYEKWGDSANETRELYRTKVFNLQVADWHTFFIGKTGLWVEDGTKTE